MQTHEEHMNDMQSCTIGSLSLHPTGNSQGGYYFYSLTMGRVITCQQYTLLPMPHEVIDHIHRKAQQENASTRLSILNHWREEIPDEPVDPHDMPNPLGDNDTTDEDSSYHPMDEAGSLPSLNKLETESVAPIQATLDELEPIGDLQFRGVDYDNDIVAAELNNETVIAEPKVMDADDGNLFVPVPVEPPANPVSTPCLSWAMKNLEIDGVTPPPPPPPPTILEAHTQSRKVLSTVTNLQVEQDGLQQALIGVVMAQYHIQKGLKVFGEAGADGVRKELQQLHDHKIPKPVHPEGLYKEQFTKGLEYLMFLKEKQSGVIKVGAAPMVVHSASTLARQNQHLPPYSQSQSS